MAVEKDKVVTEDATKAVISIVDCVACRQNHPDLEFEKTGWVTECGPAKGLVWQSVCPVKGFRIYASDDLVQYDK